MREYSKLCATFWTGETGKTLRAAGRDAQTVALYLTTCPSSNMLGLYYLPLPTLCHEIGITKEGASKALRRVSEASFAFYDASSEHVWVPEMARWQVGAALDPKDKRVTGIKRELETLRKSPFFNEFLKKYREPFHLQSVTPEASPFDVPSKPLRSQEQEQEQEYRRETPANAGSLTTRIPRLVTGSKPSASPKPDPRIKPFFDFWKQEFERRFGQAYPFNGAKEGSLIKRLPESYDFAKLKGLALTFFDSEDSWISQQGGYTIGVFCSQIAKLVSIAARNPDHDRQQGGFVG